MIGPGVAYCWFYPGTRPDPENMIRRLHSRRALCVLVLTALAPAGVHAQPAPPAPLPPGGIEEEPPAPPVKSVLPIARASDQSVQLLFPNVTIDKVLPRYEQLTGYRIIKDSNLQGANLHINVTLPRDEAIRYMEATFLLNGYALMPTESPKTYKLINYAGGKNPRSEGVRIITRPEDLPLGEEVVSYVMPLTYVDPEEAVQTFSAVVPPHAQYGAITAVPNASLVVITDNVPVVRNLIDLHKHIDIPSTKVSRKFIKLERSDAERIVEILNEIINAQSAARSSRPRTTTTATRRPPVPGGSTKQAANVTVASGELNEETVQVYADARTNRILIIARPIELAYLEALIKEFDAPLDSRQFVRHKLRFLRALDFVETAAEALLTRVDDQGQGQGRSSLGQSVRGGQAQRAGAQGFQRSGSQTGRGTGGRGSGSTGSGGADRLVDPGEALGPSTLIVGKTLLIAETATNHVVLSGPPEHVSFIQSLVEELDKRPPQIYLSCVIGQLSLEDELEFGMDLLQTVKTVNVGGQEVDLAGLFRTRTPRETNPLVDVQTLVNPELMPDIPGLSLYGQVGDFLHTYVRALEATDRFKVLSRPTVYTANSRKAVISSGERIAIPTSTLSNINNQASTSFQSNIEYEDVLLKLEVVPLINSKDEVTLEIFQVNDNVIGTQTVSGNEVPIIGTQELLTTVTVPNRSTVILGGLIQQSEEEVRSGLPLLSRIPLIKYLFSSTRIETRRRELIIMIQPTIVEGEDDLKQTNREENRRHKITRDAVRFSNPPLPVRRPTTALEPELIPRAYPAVSSPPEEKKKKKGWPWKRKASNQNR